MTSIRINRLINFVFLQPIIIELEREQMPVVVVSHRAVIRTLMGYFLNVKVQDIPYINIKLHEVVCLRPTPYGCEETRFSLGTDDAVDVPFSPTRDGK
jgi:broad specificity phosphatase PhoE